MQKTGKAVNSIYQLSSYTETALLNLRLLELQLRQLPEDSSGALSVSWGWLFKTLEISPPAGPLLDENFKESSAFCSADAYTLADYLVFEKALPKSVFNCFQKAEELARQSIEFFGEEFWRFWHKKNIDFKNIKISDLWPKGFGPFCKEAQEFIYLAYHFSRSFMYRSRQWYFLPLGRAAFRLELSSALLSNYIKFVMGYKESKKELEGLLFCAGALELYRQEHSEINFPHVLNVLMKDPSSPCSLFFFIEQMEKNLQKIDSAYTDYPIGKTAEILHAVKAKLSEPPSSLQELLEYVHNMSRKAHLAVSEEYFS